MILSDANLKLLVSQQIKKRLITNDYLKDPNNPNFKYIKEKRFVNEPDDKVALLNSGSGLFGSVVDVYSFYIGKKEGSDKNYRRFIEDFATLGFFTYSIEREEDGSYEIEYQPAENYINEKGVDTVFRRYYDTQGTTIREYILKTTFVGGVIENKLYDNTYNSNSGNEVPLDTIRETSNLLPYFDTGLPKIFFVCKEDEKEQFPRSIISKIEPLVYSIDRKIVQMDLQFLQHGEVFRIFKGLQIPTPVLDKYVEGNKLDWGKVGHDLVGNENSSIEYVSNKNELIADIMKQNENQIRQISSMTSVPVDFLGLESKEGNVGQGSRTLLQGAFLKKIERFRNFLDESFEPVSDLIEDSDAIWTDVFVKSDNELITELSTARTASLISQYTAVQQYLGLDEEGTLEEIARINEEKSQALLLAPNTMQNANPVGSKNTEEPKGESISNDGGQEMGSTNDM